jgi:hypothetical protein
MSYTAFKFGYKMESTYGTPIITAAGDTTYSWGVVSPESTFSSSTSIHKRASGYTAKEVPAGFTWKGRFNTRIMLGLTMQNGVLLWAAMGNSSTAGADPYTHTITPFTDGSSLIPSFTMVAERSGTATDWSQRYEGMKIDSLSLVHDTQDINELMARADFIAQQGTDPGFMLTNDPALPTTATTGSYPEPVVTWDSAGTPVAVDGITQVEATIHNGLIPRYGHGWDAGTYTGRYPRSLLEAPTKEYFVRLLFHPTTIEDDLWDETVATGNTKNMTIKWTKSTNDYILLTFRDCHCAVYDANVPEPADSLFDSVHIYPEALSVEVKDSLAGGAYND